MSSEIVAGLSQGIVLLLLSVGIWQSAALAMPELSAPPPQPLDLSSFLWRNRLLLIFAPHGDHPDYQSQIQLLEDQDPQLQDRDLVLIQVLGAGSSQVAQYPLTSNSITALRQRYQVSPEEFVVILVGKDGTAKRRSLQPIPPQALYAQIDSMPMRQREMRQRSGTTPQDE